MKKLTFTIIFVVLLTACFYTLGWFYFANHSKLDIDQIISNLNKNYKTNISYDKLKIHGYPLKVKVKFINPRFNIKDSSNNFTATGNMLRINFPIFANYYSIDFPTKVEISANNQLSDMSSPTLPNLKIVFNQINIVNNLGKLADAFNKHSLLDKITGIYLKEMNTLSFNNNNAESNYKVHSYNLALTQKITPKNKFYTYNYFVSLNDYVNPIMKNLGSITTSVDGEIVMFNKEAKLAVSNLTIKQSYIYTDKFTGNFSGNAIFTEDNIVSSLDFNLRIMNFENFIDLVKINIPSLNEERAKNIIRKICSLKEKDKEANIRIFLNNEEKKHLKFEDLLTRLQIANSTLQEILSSYDDENNG